MNVYRIHVDWLILATLVLKRQDLLLPTDIMKYLEALVDLSLLWAHVALN